MPTQGERRKAPDGTLVEWDGRGWLPAAVTSDAPMRVPVSGRGTQFQQPNRERIEAVADALPTIGGAIGGMAGAPTGAVAIGTAALGGAAGEAARQSIRNITRAVAGESPQMANPVAMAKEGAIQGASQAVGLGTTKAMSGTGQWLMQKAVRPGARVLDEYRTTASAIAKTLLDDGINVTQSGLEKLQRLIKADNAEIQSILKSAPKPISKDKVLSRVDQYASEAMKSQVNPKKSLAKATKVADEFVEHPYYTSDTIMSPDAQMLKVGTYQEIGDAFNKPQRARALKAAARGLKEEIATAHPEVSSINAREASRMAAGESVASAIQKDASSDPLGLLFAASNPQLFIAGLINRQPVIKSMLARGLYRSASVASGVPENAIRGAVYAIASGEEDEK